MKVVLTKQLCEISGYFKTLSEDPECKEIEISDEYTPVIEAMMLLIDDEKKFDLKMFYQGPLIASDQLTEFRQLCAYFECEKLTHYLKLAVYDHYLLSDSQLNQDKDMLIDVLQMMERFEKYGIDLDSTQEFEEWFNDLEHNVQHSLYVLPISFWERFILKYMKRVSIYLTYLYCPYESVIITLVDEKHSIVSLKYCGIEDNTFLSDEAYYRVISYIDSVINNQEYGREIIIPDRDKVYNLNDFIKDSWLCECINYAKHLR